MPRHFLTVIRVLLLPVFVFAGFMVYGHSLDFFSELIPTPHNKSLILAFVIAEGLVTAILVSSLFCYPLAFIYQQYALIVALIMILPVLVLRLPELSDFDQSFIAFFISAYEIAAYAILLVLGSWLTHRRIMRTKAMTKPGLLQSESLAS